MQGTNVSSQHSTDNFFTAENGTTLKSKIYKYNANEPSTRRALSILLVLVGIAGFVGNVLVLYFLKTKKGKASFLRTFSFEKNVCVYIKSLATSDVLSCLISVPYLCVEFNYDLFNTGRHCKIARYMIYIFPSVTMSNLLLLNIEKYFATRKVPRTFRHSTVKKMVFFAWVASCLIVFLPAATCRGIRFDINETHYTVVCRFDNQYLPFNIMFLTYAALQYMIPMIIIIRINISLIITVLTITKRRKTVNVQRDNGIKMKLRAATIRSIWIIIALTFAFIFPYLVYFAQITYNHVVKVKIDFKTDVTLRGVGALVAMANPAVNAALYFVQLRDFRHFLKKKVLSWIIAKNLKPVRLVEGEIQLVKLSTLTLTTAT